MVIGIVLAGAVIKFDFTQLEKYSRYLYAAAILILIIVLVLGKEVRGSTGWIGVGSMTLQPAEFVKILVILSFTEFLHKRIDRLNTLWEMIPCFLYMGLPSLLVAIQPNIGLALAFVFITLRMMLVAGANYRILLTVFTLSVSMAILIVFLHQHYGLWMPLKDYQLQRLLVFANPYNDGQGGRGAGWNTIQSLIAIGSGGLTGTGLYNGAQVQLNFLPEAHTDFIFAVLGEELGFIGATLLIVLYGVLLMRTVTISFNARAFSDRLIVAGITSMWLFHIFENIGMCIGIMPVTGIPLPFLSYGGSSMLSNMIGVGLVLGINIKEKKIVF